MNEKPEHLLTIGHSSQFTGLFHDRFMKGHGEPRVAMVGRSNVGKSSLINALLGARLAQTSKQPGKTRAIHFYSWKEAKTILVDLPGYGYAKAGREERGKWEKFIRGYFEKDPALRAVLLLLDARHGPTEIDQEAIEFLSSWNIPVIFVFTKQDTLKTQSQKAVRQREAVEALSKLGYKVDSVFWVSSLHKNGLKELRNYFFSGKGDGR